MTKRLCMTLALLCALIGGSLVMGPAPAAFAEKTPSEADGPTKDVLILRSGAIVEGQILSETDTEIRMQVVFRGITAPTTYRKADVLEIQRDVSDEAAAATTTPATPANSRTPGPAEKPRAGSTEGGARVYLIELEGDMGGNVQRGGDISKTPLQQVFDDAISHKPDVIIVKMDCGTAIRRFDGLFITEGMSPIVEKALTDGHRVVFWIENANFGAAFLPFVSPEIYFTSDGRLGGVGDLGDFDMGDAWVNEKQISLRLGHAEGFAIRGGYDPALIRAMARKSNWLAVRFVGGNPVYIEHQPRPEDGDGWTILSDDGEGKNKDEFSFEGNDVLNLDADWAERLRVSKGTVDDIDELVFRLRVGRDYEIIEGRAKRILEKWKDDVERARSELRRIQEQLEERPTGRDQRAIMGQRKRLLEQARGIFAIYAEIFDPNGAQRAQIDVELEGLRQSIQRSGNAPARRGGGSAPLTPN